MANRLLFSFLLLCFASQLISQDWRMGILALNSGEHIVGEINYDYDNNSVQISYDNKTFAYSAYQFYSFRLVKNDLFPERNFFVLEYNENDLGRPTPHIFESIYSGDVSLFVRSYEGMSHTRSWYRNNNYDWDTSNQFDNSSGNNRYQKIKKTFYKQYLVWKDGKVVRLKGGKKERIRVIGGDKNELLRYAKRYGLNLQRRYDMAMLVKYHNDLQNPSLVSKTQ